VNYTFGKHRLLFIVIGVAVVALASLPFLMSASCLTRPQTLAEQRALDTLRNMTRKDAALAEMARVTRPGGRVLVLEFSRPWKPLSRAYDAWPHSQSGSILITIAPRTSLACNV